MALSIKDADTDHLARRLARATGETLTKTVHDALVERLKSVQIQKTTRKRPKDSRLIEDLTAIARKYNSLPDRDRRTPDEIIGYNERGHFD